MSESDKGKRDRRAYLDAFKKNGEGSYVYTGELYHFQGKEGELKRKLRILWALCIGMLGVSAGACSVEAPGTVNCAYVLLPCVAVFLGSIGVCWGICRLSMGGDPLRAYIYKASVCKIPGRIAFVGVSAGASALGEVIYSLKNGLEGKAAGFFLFLILQGAALAAAVFMGCCMKKMHWEV